MKAKLRGVELFFDIDGPALALSDRGLLERPTAFLIHGGPGVDHTGLKARYGDLAKRMQVVYFDHRGHGRSSRGDPKSYSLEENVEDMEALRQHLGIDSFVSIGTSYGGMVALAHAAKYPDSVSHLILIATASHKGFIDRAQQLVEARGTAAQQEQFQLLLSGELDTPDAVANYFIIMNSLYARHADPALSAEGLKRAILSPEPMRMAFGPNGTLRRFDLRTEIAAITVPTLICAGRYDWICAPEFSEEIKGLIPHADLRIFDDSAHSIGGDEHQKLIDCINGFLVYSANQSKAAAKSATSRAL